MYLPQQNQIVYPPELTNSQKKKYTQTQNQTYKDENGKEVYFIKQDCVITDDYRRCINEIITTPKQNILTIYDICKHSNSFYLGTECQDGPKILTNALNDQQKEDAIIQIAKGLQELHKMSYIHRNVCPETIKQINGQWKLTSLQHVCDFVCVQYPPPVGLFNYHAPEYANGKNYREQIDIFALACVAYELFSSEKLFINPNEPRNKIPIRCSDKLNKMPPYVKEFIQHNIECPELNRKFPQKPIVFQTKPPIMVTDNKPGDQVTNQQFPKFTPPQNPPFNTQFLQEKNGTNPNFNKQFVPPTEGFPKPNQQIKISPGNYQQGQNQFQYIVPQKIQIIEQPGVFGEISNQQGKQSFRTLQSPAQSQVMNKCQMLNSEQTPNQQINKEHQQQEQQLQKEFQEKQEKLQKEQNEQEQKLLEEQREREKKQLEEKQRKERREQETNILVVKDINIRGAIVKDVEQSEEPVTLIVTKFITKRVKNQKQ